jgi:hypothetical protein
VEFPQYPGWLANVVRNLEEDKSAIVIEVFKQRFEGKQCFHFVCDEKQMHVIASLPTREDPNTATFFFMQRHAPDPSGYARPEMKYACNSKQGVPFLIDSDLSDAYITKALTDFFTSSSDYPLSEVNKIGVTNDYSEYENLKNSGEGILFYAYIVYSAIYSAPNSVKRVKLWVACIHDGVDELELDFRLGDLKGASVHPGRFLLKCPTGDRHYITSRREFYQYYADINRVVEANILAA